LADGSQQLDWAAREQQADGLRARTIAAEARSCTRVLINELSKPD
jgi:hypothetical protein